MQSIQHLNPSMHFPNAGPKYATKRTDTEHLFSSCSLLYATSKIIQNRFRDKQGSAPYICRVFPASRMEPRIVCELSCTLRCLPSAWILSQARLSSSCTAWSLDCSTALFICSAESANRACTFKEQGYKPVKILILALIFHEHQTLCSKVVVIDCLA